MAAGLAGWDVGVVAYGTVFALVTLRAPLDRIQQVFTELDEGRWGILASTIIAALASLGAIVAELARVHGTPHAGWTGGEVLGSLKGYQLKRYPLARRSPPG